MGGAPTEDKTAPPPTAMSQAKATPSPTPTKSAEQLEAERKERERKEEEERQRRAEEEKKAAEEAAAKAAAEAEAKAALKDKSTYEAISERDWKIVEQKPGDYVGKKYVIYGYVTRTDANTAPAFRANTSGEKKRRWYDYPVNTLVIPGDDIEATVVTDDLVTLYVEVREAFSYSTTMGGSTTVPAVTAHVVEITGQKK